VLVKYAVLIFFSLVILVPLAVTFLGGFKTSAEILLEPFGLPQEWRPDNYQEVLTSRAFWQNLLNSTLVMLATAVGVVALASMAAFVFARLSFRGRELLYTFMVLGFLFPITVAILPLYITLRQSGLVDTLWAVILPQVAFGLPLNILILRGFFIQVPQELEEAAALDGCSSFGFFWRVLLPLARPALAAVFVLTMVVSWNNFLLPLIVINSEALYTLPLGIMQFQGQWGADWARIMAYLSLSLIPAVAFYLIAERQIVSGLMAGAVKG
jgi:raffinose/stachyose/melibiose transport system permease protein